MTSPEKAFRGWQGAYQPNCCLSISSEWLRLKPLVLPLATCLVHIPGVGPPSAVLAQPPPSTHSPALGSHDAAGTLGLAPATGLVVGLDEGLYSILQDTAHCPSHHEGTPVPAGTTPRRPKSQGHTPPGEGPGPPEGWREGQRMKGPGGPWEPALAGATPPRLPVRPGVSIKTFQDRREGAEWKTTTMRSRSSRLGRGVPGSLWIHPFIRVPVLCQSLAWHGLCEPAGDSVIPWMLASTRPPRREARTGRGPAQG